MSLASAIFDKLSNDTSVAALVGTRIEPYPSRSTQYPMVIYDIGLQGDETVDQDAEAYRAEVVIWIEALTRATADAVAIAIRNALKGQEWVTAETRILGVKFENQSTDALSDSGNPERIYFSTEQTYSVVATV